MSWKCDCCDSYNEDSDFECFVCGERRSKESIREARRAKTVRFLFVFLKVLFLSLIALLTVSAAAAIIVKASGGGAYSLASDALTVLHHALDNLTRPFTYNIRVMALHTADCSFLHFANNAGLVLHAADDSLGRLFGTVSQSVWSAVSGNAGAVLAESGDSLSGSLVSGLRLIGESISAVFADIESSLRTMAGNMAAFFNELIHLT